MEADRGLTGLGGRMYRNVMQKLKKRKKITIEILYVTYANLLRDVSTILKPNEKLLTHKYMKADKIRQTIQNHTNQPLQSKRGRLYIDDRRNLYSHLTSLPLVPLKNREDKKRIDYVNPTNTRNNEIKSSISQMVRDVTGISQNACNCGLFCIRMAIESLNPLNPPPLAQYDLAAENAGSKVGEIFDFATMQNIVTNLGHTAQRIDFTNIIEFQQAIIQSGTNPTLIAFSNYSYRAAMGQDPGALPHTQRGHWAVITGFNQVNHQLTMVNPNGGIQQHINLNDMFAANQQMADNGNPQFNWSSFVGRHYNSMVTPNKYHLAFTALGQIVRTITAVPGNIQFNPMQNLDLSGYIVVIT